MIKHLENPAVVATVSVLLLAAVLWTPMVMMSVSGDGMQMSTPTGWTPGLIIGTSVMWLFMMLAMMLPSMAPMIATYAMIAANEDSGSRLVLRVTVFSFGYFALWALFSVVMAVLQLSLRESVWFLEGGTRAVPATAGVLMLVAGGYQLTPIKDKCLEHCRSPMAYILSHWKNGLAGAFPMGLHHGLFCVGCCGVFMGLMFVFGTMTVWWMAAMAMYFVAEKMLPRAEVWSRGVGFVLIAAGLATLGHAFTN